MLPDSVKFADFYIDALFDNTLYAATFEPWSGFNLISTAFATDCVTPGEAGSLEEITTIEVITLNNYDSIYPAAANITPLVTVDNKSIPEFVAYLKTTGIRQQFFSFRFKTEPDKLPGNYAFRMKISFANGETYMAETKPVKLF